MTGTVRLLLDKTPQAARRLIRQIMLKFLPPQNAGFGVHSVQPAHNEIHPQALQHCVASLATHVSRWVEKVAMRVDRRRGYRLRPHLTYEMY